jgi:glutathione peroxidase
MRWASLLFLIGCRFFQSDTRSEIPSETVQAVDWLSALSLVRLDGETFDTKMLDNKIVLVVNVASRCGFTSQYDGLQDLWTAYRDQGLVVIGAPCNQFGGQEPGQPEEIASFCRSNYGVDFPLLEKQDVHGENQSALYSFLVNSPVGEDSEVVWNFEKFLVGTDGTILGRYRSRTAPDDPDLVADIVAALATLDS